MRWNSKQAHREGDMRTREVFAWLPMPVGDEVVWVENVWVRERCDITDGIVSWIVVNAWQEKS